MHQNEQERALGGPMPMGRRGDDRDDDDAADTVEDRDDDGSEDQADDANTAPPRGGVKGPADWFGFPIYVARRFGRDACPSVAASLGFTSLLALVPILVIGLAMLAAFPAFGDLRTMMVGILFRNFLPDMSDAIYEQISTFMNNAGKSTGFGILGLALTAVLLINTIQSAFDRIWRGSARRKALARLPVYWALITLGPILFGLSISLSGHLFRAAEGGAAAFGVDELVRVAISILPFLLQAAGFALVYWLLPTRPVRLRDAVVGGIVAAILFEVLKQGFGIYLRLVPSYEVIYGALASVPVFLFWMYLLWSIALVGAEVAAALPEWRAGRRAVGAGMAREDALKLALSVLILMGREQARGKGLRLHKFVDKLPVDAVRSEELLETLSRAHYRARTEAGRWIISRDLRQTTVRDLAATLNLALEAKPMSGQGQSRFPLVDQVVADLRRAEGDALGMSVQSLVDRVAGGGLAPLSAPRIGAREVD